MPSQALCLNIEETDEITYFSVQTDELGMYFVTAAALNLTNRIDYSQGSIAQNVVAQSGFVKGKLR